jgi:hypothetical protein
MEETIEQLKESLRKKGIDPEKALSNIYATLSFYIDIKPEIEIILDSDVDNTE